MENNIFKFLQIYKNKSYDEVPVCEGDIVVGAIVAYMDFMKSPKTKKHDLENNVINFDAFYIKNSIDKLVANYFNQKDSKEFLKVMFTSKRYHSTKVGYFESHFSEDDKVQFFAFTAITKNYACVFFRGTDTSLVGWKEDLDLAYKEKIPSQKLAKGYLYRIAERTDKPIIIAGHSKGGNLAAYAYLCARKDVQKRVVRVYNFDGPGLSMQNIKGRDDDQKLIKIVPSRAIVGMLLETTDNYHIIRSYKKNIRAHDLFSWTFSSSSRYTMLKKNPPLSKYSVALKTALNEWIIKYSKKDMHDMADFIYRVAISNKQSSTLDLKLDIIKKRKIYLNEITEYSNKKKEKLKLMSRDFVKMYFTALIKK